MSHKNQPATPAQLEQDLSELKSEVSALKKLVYQIDDLVAGNIRSMIADTKKRNEAPGE